MQIAWFLLQTHIPFSTLEACGIGVAVN